MADHSENSHDPTRTPAPAPSKAFPENQEPKGRTHFGPAPSKPRPSVGNVLNTDRFGKRVPRDR